MTNNKRDINNIKLIAIDIDGTLLNNSQFMTPRTKNALKSAMDANIKIILATGKSYYSAKNIVKEFSIKTHGIYLQGSIICRSTGAIVSEEMINDKQCAKVLQLAGDIGVTTLLYSKNSIFSQEKNLESQRLIAYGEPKPTLIRSFQEIISTHKIHKIVILGIDYKDKINTLKEYINSRKDFRVRAIVGGLEGMIEILPQQVSKGAALGKLIGAMKIHANEVLAIGDGENDIEMLKLAGTSVAMGNATTRLKGLADFIVSSNEQDGVAEAIERFVMRPQLAYQSE